MSSLETGGGVVHAAVIGPNGVQIFSSPVGVDSWTGSSATIELGADIVEDELGFTTTTQGVAIVSTGTTEHLLMTYDGGRSWRLVSFR